MTCSGATYSTSKQVLESQDDAISNLGVWLACIFYIVGYPGLYLGDPFAQARYLIYFTSILIAAPLLFSFRPYINLPALYLFVIYFLGGVAVWRSGEVPEPFVVNFVAVALTLLAFIPRANVSERQISVLFYGTFICALINFLLISQGKTRLLALVQSGTGSGLVDAYDNLEGLMAPIYAAYFYSTGATGLLVAAVGMTLWGGKRIGFLALVVVITVVWVMRKADIFKRRAWRFAALLIVLGTINVVGINAITISEILHRVLDIPVHIEEVMLGRHQIGIELHKAMAEKPTIEWLFGSGAGAADDVSGRLWGTTGILPHNDWLKIVFDYGVIGSLIATLFMAFMFSTSLAGTAIGIATGVIMMTDNVLIYVFYQFPAIAMVAAASSRSRAKCQASGT